MTVRAAADVALPTRHGSFRAVGYESQLDGTVHVALVAGDVTADSTGDVTGDIAQDQPVLVRVHSECLTGDVLGSCRCDCGPQLRAGLDAITAEGRGVLLYVRGHEGRGIGLRHKLQAYRLQDGGADTVDANLELGLPVDARDYAAAAEVLTHLGITRVRLLTNNPAKLSALQKSGVEVVERVPVPVHPHPDNLRYLITKRDRMGHQLPGLPAPP